MSDPSGDENISVPDLTRAITRGTTRLFVHLGCSALNEFSLKTGRRVDVIGLNKQGKIIVAEVKASISDFRGDTKWPEYKEFCDQFYFAVSPDFPRDILPPAEQCGIILADAYGGEILRDAPEGSLNAARRKSVTLSFARTAASRLHILGEEVSG